ncbi:hypothetical protein BsWGS_07893 [Bradybaena similaris]
MTLQKHTKELAATIVVGCCSQIHTFSTPYCGGLLQSDSHLQHTILWWVAVVRFTPSAHHIVVGCCSQIHTFSTPYCGGLLQSDSLSAQHIVVGCCSQIHTFSTPYCGGLLQSDSHLQHTILWWVAAVRFTPSAHYIILYAPPTPAQVYSGIPPPPSKNQSKHDGKKTTQGSG